MFGRETRMLLKHYLEQGTSKSALARKLGVHRDTIYRWIREGELDRDLEGEPVRYGPRRAVPTKLDAYKAIIETRLAAYPQLSAVRLLAEIRAAGFEGSYTQLKAFVQGATAAATGALSGAVVVLALRAVYDVPTAAIALISFAVLWRYKVSEPVLVITAGLVGLVVWPLLGRG